jgi:hypothetical protein
MTARQSRPPGLASLGPLYGCWTWLSLELTNEPAGDGANPPSLHAVFVSILPCRASEESGRCCQTGGKIHEFANWVLPSEAFNEYMDTDSQLLGLRRQVAEELNKNSHVNKNADEQFKEFAENRQEMVFCKQQ